ncbi:TAM domain methyltransferase [Colletotrichum karsti]|uniref:TAM domain methyltransferase n=1 Tax=Colletotrichum karsti TaxID=1095194 RepID=A0A9P6HWP5_9PEZI|nr:TAM domain methyltransferase [Colletotrichum karsti]KAF9871894.1 TAM domain methyltransferase [Colletotrichum karsti]
MTVTMASPNQPLAADDFDSDSVISEVSYPHNFAPFEMPGLRVWGFMCTVNLKADDIARMKAAFEFGIDSFERVEVSEYSFPNDEREAERLDLQHHMWMLTLRGKLCLCPKGDEPAKRVLDCGTGTGIWAMEYADAHPEAKVIGVDLSPMQPSWIPPNVSFELDDLEKDWTWSKPFDFIFGRVLAGSISNYQDFFNKAFANLEPGGYLEMQDFALPYGCDDGTLSPNSPLHRLSTLFREGTAKAGRRMDVAPSYQTLMRAAGFEGVVEWQSKWPVNRWPRDPHYKELGMWTHANLDTGLEGLTLALFTRFLGWSSEETLAFCAEVRTALKDLRTHAYLPM